MLAAALLAVPLTDAAAQTRTQLEVSLAMPAAAVKARVQAAFASDGVPITEASGDLVVGTYKHDNWRTVRFRAAVIPADSATSRVILTGTLATPATGAFPAQEHPLTDKASRRTTGKQGREAWRRMERIAAAIAPGSTVGR